MGGRGEEAGVCRRLTKTAVASQAGLGVRVSLQAPALAAESGFPTAMQGGGWGSLALPPTSCVEVSVQMFCLCQSWGHCVAQRGQPNTPPCPSRARESCAGGRV